ncbi:MAG: HDOD domain-containing protein [Bacteroidetes bacterium]|nr:HDOD domain-containing protein [Bacteroidota bacterium]
MNNETVDINEKREKNRKFLMNIRNLPSIPMVMTEASSLLENPRTSAAELGKLISKDQGLTAKILSVANSPLYGLPRRVSTIEFAIVILGFDHIKNIVIALSMIEAFKNENGKNWNRKAYWSHSLMTASASKRIADDLGYNKTSEAFTAGLLHDLGIAVIQRYFKKEFDEICLMNEEQGIRHSNAEKLVLGMGHHEIGQILADKWNLPKSLGDTIVNHHLPSASEKNKVLSSIVHLADFMTQRLGVGDFSWDENMELDTNILQILNMGDAVYLDRFIQSYETLFRSQLEMLTI